MCTLFTKIKLILFNPTFVCIAPGYSVIHSPYVKSSGNQFEHLPSLTQLVLVLYKDILKFYKIILSFIYFNFSSPPSLKSLNFLLSV